MVFRTARWVAVYRDRCALMIMSEQRSRSGRA